jgi:hypothetical protein
MRVAIHQPNFFPWYPYFEKILRADIFVILQNCQFEKNNFQNRFSFDNKWYSMRVHRGLENIVCKNYVNASYDWEKIKRGFPKQRNKFELFDDCINENLAITNSNIIIRACEILNIKTTIVFDYPTDLTSTERLIDIVKHYGGNEYISGPSGLNYMNLALFEQNNIGLSIHENSNKKALIEMI